MDHTPSSTFVRTLLAAGALTLVALGTAPPVKAQGDFARLEAVWKRRDYARALPALRDYRLRTNIRNAQIDYMIATSACRTPNHREDGNAYFGWILENYTLSSQSREIIESERRRCSSSGAPQVLPPASPSSLVGIMYSGKGGTGILATGSGNSETAVVNAIPPEVFQSRLFALSQSNAAVSRLREQFGSDSQIERVGYFALVVPAKSKPAPFPASPDSSLPGRLNVSNQAAISNQVNRPPDVTQKAPSVHQPSPPPPPNPPRTPLSPEGVTQATPNAPDVPTQAPPNSPGGFPAEQRTLNPAFPTNRTQNSGDRGREQVQVTQQPLSTSTGAGKSDLIRVGEDLQRYAQYFISEYGMKTPDYLITVYFAPNVNELRSLATNIHGIELPRGSIGYSYPVDQSMVAWADGSAYGTFAHELFHLMLRGNFGDAPPWLDEGMAALYEVSGFEGDRAVGRNNWRHRILRDLWGIRPSLRQLVQMNRKDFDDVDPTPHISGGDEKLVAGARQSANHATARYFMFYLQERRELSAVYRAFFNRDVSDQPGRKAVELVESVLGRSLDQVDDDFARWFKSLRD